MKKGDLRKQEILQTAEQMFCRNGYEQTSVQDILDQLKTSKGSFYHHFESKEALLATVCSQRAYQSKDAVASDAAGQKNAAGKLNCLLTGMIPFHDEKLSFILMLLPTFVLPEGKSLKTSYCESLRDAFFPDIRNAVAEGVDSGEMICDDPDLYSDMIITLVNRLWVSVCEIIIENERGGNETDLYELLHMTEQYRTALERILTIPYGSLVLFDINALNGMKDRIHYHWNDRIKE